MISPARQRRILRAALFALGVAFVFALLYSAVHHLPRLFMAWPWQGEFIGGGFGAWLTYMVAALLLLGVAEAVICIAMLCLALACFAARKGLACGKRFGYAFAFWILFPSANLGVSLVAMADWPDGVWEPFLLIYWSALGVLAWWAHRGYSAASGGSRQASKASRKS